MKALISKKRAKYFLILEERYEKMKDELVDAAVKVQDRIAQLQNQNTDRYYKPLAEQAVRLNSINNTSVVLDYGRWSDELDNTAIVPLEYITSDDWEDLFWKREGARIEEEKRKEAQRLERLTEMRKAAERSEYERLKKIFEGENA